MNKKLIAEIFKKRDDYSSGTTVINCMEHSHLLYGNRPENCKLCYADMQNIINRLFSVNNFMNSLLDDLQELTQED